MSCLVSRNYLSTPIFANLTKNIWKLFLHKQREAVNLNSSFFEDKIAQIMIRNFIQIILRNIEKYDSQIPKNSSFLHYYPFPLLLNNNEITRCLEDNFSKSFYLDRRKEADR